MIEDWGSVKFNQGELFVRSINRLKEQLVRLNQQQLEAGVDANGRKLPPYSSSYAKVRARKGLQTEWRDLKVTGDFHNSFYVLAFEKYLEMGGKDWKTRFLDPQYNDPNASVTHPIFGLDDEDFDEFISLLKPIFIEETRKVILTGTNALVYS